MQQIKIFKSVDTEIAEMEKQMNRWLRKTGVRVLSVTGNLTNQNQSTGPMSSFSAGDVMVIILYEVDVK